MKKILSILSLMVLSVMLYAQTPQSFSYQTVIRDANWNVLANQSVGIEISILEDATNGVVVYKESHSSITSQIGLVNLAIGEGTVVNGDFTTIDWGNHTYFVEVAVDVTGGSAYQVMGTTQLRSVPYALYAETAGNPGPVGATGPQGPPGVDGVDGADGADAIVDYDSLATIISVDSSFIANVSGSSTNINQTILMANIPSFLSGDLLDTIIPNQSSYTVPTGKQLFVQFAKTFPNPEPIIIDGQHISCSPTAGAGNNDWKRLIMDENETLSFGIYGSLNLHGSLVDKNSNENWITIVLDDVNNLSYTVPSGKKVFINSVVVSCASNYSGNIEGLEIGNILFQPSNSNATATSLNDFDKLTFPENTTITLITNSNPSMVIIRALLY